MDIEAAEDSNPVRAAAVLVAVVICLGICFRFVLHDSVGAISSSVTRGFVVVEHADHIVDDLDQLRISQRALLYSGGGPYSELAAISISEIIGEISALEQLNFADQDLSIQVRQVSLAVDRALKLVGTTNQLQQLCGDAAALAVFDEDADKSILAARLNVVELKLLATEDVFHRVRAQRDLRSALRVLF
jgi:hypothetical protein